MTTSPHLPDQPPDYKVGYGRPPLHTRVKHGQVLNPKGRPKGQRNTATVVQDAVNELINIKVGNRTRRVTKLDAIMLRITNDAALGNAKAQTNLFTLMRG